MISPHAITAIARGANTAEIRLRWGAVTWRASSEEITGTTLDKVPFTIQGVSRDGLLQWLRGALVQAAFPKMTAEDREVLISGYSSLP